MVRRIIPSSGKEAVTQVPTALQTSVSESLAHVTHGFMHTHMGGTEFGMPGWMVFICIYHIFFNNII